MRHISSRKCRISAHGNAGNAAYRLMVMRHIGECCILAVSKNLSKFVIPFPLLISHQSVTLTIISNFVSKFVISFPHSSPYPLPKCGISAVSKNLSKFVIPFPLVVSHQSVTLTIISNFVSKFVISFPHFASSHQNISLFHHNFILSSSSRFIQKQNI